MNNWSNSDKELQRLQDIGKLKWNLETKRWNKKFHPITDDENNFIKWKFGDWPRLNCAYCGKIIKNTKSDPKFRKSKFCSMEHARSHSLIMSRAKRKFGFLDDSTKSWFVIFPAIYEYYYDKKGKFRERKFKDRVESKDIEISINGERQPYTTKSRSV